MEDTTKKVFLDDFESRFLVSHFTYLACNVVWEWMIQVVDEQSGMLLS